ncbi:MAG: biotin transporter BioY [Hyphomicrobiales bacterium]
MNTKDIVYIALFAAVYAALGLFPPILIPIIGVPITAQSMGPMIAGSILGARRGALASLLFLVLVAIGLPLLSGGRGGFGVFLGPSGGFLVAYPFAALAIGAAFERLWHRINFGWAFAINAIGGIGIVYLIGIPWLSFVGNLPFTTALLGSAAFIPGDLIKAIIAAFVAVTVKKSYPIIEPAR